jgi:hypothetical protein
VFRDKSRTGFLAILKICSENYNIYVDFTVLCIQIRRKVSFTLVFGVVRSLALDKESKYGFSWNSRSSRKVFVILWYCIWIVLDELNLNMTPKQTIVKRTHKIHSKKKKTPWPKFASELYRPSDRRLSAKLVPTFVDRGCHVVSVTDPYGSILSFLDRSKKGKAISYIKICYFRSFKTKTYVYIL